MSLEDLRPVHRRVEDRPALAAGAGHDQHVDALVDVARHRGGTLAGLVVGMGVHRHETQLLLGHARTPTPSAPTFSGQQRAPGRPDSAARIRYGGRTTIGRGGSSAGRSGRAPDPGSTAGLGVIAVRCYFRRSFLIRFPTPAPEEHPVSMTDNTAPVTWLTREAYDRLKAELRQPHRGRTAISAEISARREEGDLRENGGYHAAREEQGKQEARIRQLHELLRTAQVGEAPTDVRHRRAGHGRDRPVRGRRGERDVPHRLPGGDRRPTWRSTRRPPRWARRWTAPRSARPARTRRRTARR